MGEIVLNGISASEGMASGVLVQYQADHSVVVDRIKGNVAEEKSEFKRAMTLAQTDLSKLMSGNETLAAEILEFQFELLDDADFNAPVLEAIANGIAADVAWVAMIDSEIADYASSEDEYLAARADDLKDLKRRVQLAMSGADPMQIATEYSEKIILAADEFTPSEFLEMDMSRVAAIATRGGSPTSHVAILARSRGIPMIVGCSDELLKVANGAEILFDAHEAVLVVDPRDVRRKTYNSRLEQVRQSQSNADALINQPALTMDGEKVKIYANVDDPKNLPDVTPFDGVGLTRTEFLFEDGKPPSEDEQYAIYASIIEWADGRPVTIRTLDAGGDKPISGVTPVDETNPFLGVRGFRLSVTQKEMFAVQLRALARAAALGPLKIMVPMITIPAEMTEFRELFSQIVSQLEQDGAACGSPQLGMMVEVPAAALEAEQFEADFYSIGSNDLAQYTLAIARDNPKMTYLAEPGSVAVMKLIGMTIAAGISRNVEVSVCGDMASIPSQVSKLLAVGVRSLSVALSSVANVKQSVRQWSANNGKS